MTGWRRIIATPESIGPLFLRLALGVVMFAHGAQKVLGWWGGPGVEGTFAAFEQAYGIPPWLTVLPMAAEFLGGLLLIVGLFGRVAALAIGVDMLVAMFVGGHVANGFFMNWFGQMTGEGFEYHILAIGMAAALVAQGSGAASIDRTLMRGREERVVVEPAPTAAPRDPVVSGRR